MPRNSGGVYTLPAGNPVVTGTTISSVWANTTLSDIGTALSDSLSRSGSGGMTAPLQLDAGAIGAPGLTWSAETTSGLYRNAAGDFRYAIAGSNVFGLAAGGARLADGSVGTPSLSFLSDTDLGIYRIGANNLGISAGGALIVNIDTTGMSITGAFSISGVLRVGDGSAGAPSFSFANDIDTGMYLDAVGQIGWSVGGTRRMALDANSLYMVNGVVGSPAFAFINDNDTGMYLTGIGTLGFATAGVRRVYIDTQMNGNAGTFGAPFYTFDGDTNTGIYRDSADLIGITAGGSSSFLVGVGHVYVPDGTQALPGISFITDNDSGMFRVGADDIAIITGGQVAARFLSNQQSVFVSGTVGNPGISFIGDTNTGIYRSSADVMVFATAGANAIILDSTQNARFADGLVTTPSITFQSDPDTGLYWTGANTFAVTLNGAQTLRFSASSTTFNTTTPGLNAMLGITFVPIAANDNTMGIVWQAPGGGTASQAGIWVQGSSLVGTRMYLATTDNFSTGAKTAVVIDESQRVRFVDGTAALPTLTFISDTDTGFYRFAADQIGVALAGVTAGYIAQGSFTGTLTGFAAGPSVACRWQRFGNMVMLTVGTGNSTSNSTSFGMSGLPADIRPTAGFTTQRKPLAYQTLADNSVALTTALTVSVETGGTLVFYTNGSSTGFTASGTKGVNQLFVITYYVGT